MWETTPGSYTKTTVSFPSLALANNQPVYDGESTVNGFYN
jgi:hypothetical protein